MVAAASGRANERTKAVGKAGCGWQGHSAGSADGSPVRITRASCNISASPALNVGYGGEGSSGGVYHSAYDTYEHHSTFVDPGFAYAGALRAKRQGAWCCACPNRMHLGGAFRRLRRHGLDLIVTR